MPLSIGFVEKVVAQGGAIIGVSILDKVSGDNVSSDNPSDNVSTAASNVGAAASNVGAAASKAMVDTKDAKSEDVSEDTKPAAKKTKELIIHCRCAQGHEWKGSVRNISKRWCVPCNTAAALKERFQTTAILCDTEWTYSDKCFTMSCELGHRFVVESHIQQHGCHVCSTLRAVNAFMPADRQLSIASDIVCRMRKTILAWKCSGCQTTFSATPETLLKHVGIKKCPHAIKFGGIHSNGIICKNIMEGVFMRRFDDAGVAEFGKRGPTAYNAELKLAIHYTDPKETAWNRLIVSACREHGINLIKVNHTKWTQEPLIRHVIEKLALYADIPDQQFIIDELQPGMFTTMPHERLPREMEPNNMTLNAPLRMKPQSQRSHYTSMSAVASVPAYASPSIPTYASPSIPTRPTSPKFAPSPSLSPSPMRWQDSDSSIAYDLQYSGASSVEWAPQMQKSEDSLSGDEVVDAVSDPMYKDYDGSNDGYTVNSSYSGDDNDSASANMLSVADALNSLLYESD